VLSSEPFKAAVVASFSTLLQVNASSIQVAGVQPVYASELAAAGMRRRLAGGRALQPGVAGYRVLVDISVAAASASPVLSAAIASGSSLAAALSSTVQTAVASGSITASIAANSPGSATLLGYSSAADFASSVKVDAMRPTTIKAPTSGGAASGSSGTAPLAGGAIVGIVIGCLVAVAAVAFVVMRSRPWAAAQCAVPSAIATPATPAAQNNDAFASANPMISGKKSSV